MPERRGKTALKPSGQPARGGLNSLIGAEDVNNLREVSDANYLALPGITCTELRSV
jgi:hypothetical protein